MKQPKTSSVMPVSQNLWLTCKLAGKATKRLSVAIGCLLLLALPGMAQKKGGMSTLNEIKADVDQKLTKQKSGLPNLSEDVLMYNHAYWAYQTEAINHRRRVYNWQYKSSIGIFAMVTLIVISGIAFSGMQFYIAVNASKKTIGTTTMNADAVSSNIEVSHDGIKITSSVLGVIILTLSIVFFFLYLKYVYPVSELPNITLKQAAMDSPAGASSPAKTDPSSPAGP